MLTPDPQQQRAIEHREFSQTIAKTETQIAALRRFAALPPETVAAVKEEASAMGRRAYEALECNAARVANALQHGVDRAKGDADAADWRVIRKAHTGSTGLSLNSRCPMPVTGWAFTSGVWTLSVSIEIRWRGSSGWRK